jgi:hypothetical protein
MSLLLSLPRRGRSSGPPSHSLSFTEKVDVLKSLPEGAGPVERSAGTGIPFVSKEDLARR